MPDEWRFQALKKLNCCKKIEMKKIVKFGIFRVHPDQFLDEFDRERRCRNVLHQIPKSFFKTSKHFLKSPRAISALMKVSAGCPENVQSLPRNRAVDSAALYGRFREVVSGGNGKSKNKNPRRCGSPGISSTVRCEDGF